MIGFTLSLTDEVLIMFSCSFSFSQNNYKLDYCCVLFQCCRRAERLWPAWKQTSRKSAFVFSTVCTSLTCTIEGLTFWSVNWGLGLESPWEKFVMRPLTESAVIISTAPIHCWREYETVSGRDSCRDMLRLGGAIDLQALHTHGCSGLWLKWPFLSLHYWFEIHMMKKFALTHTVCFCLIVV